MLLCQGHGSRADLPVSSEVQGRVSPRVLGRRTLEIRDDTRDKELAIDVWYPVSPDTPGREVQGVPWVTPLEAVGAEPVGQGLPVVMLSHGFHGSPATLTWLIEALVSQGFVVAGPTHDDPNALRGYLHMNHWERAVDVSVSLTALLKSDLGSHLNPDKVGMIGYSLGGGTGIWLAGGLATEYRRTANPGPAYAPEDEFFPVGSPEYEYLVTHTDFEKAAGVYRDPRLRAVLLLAPSLGWAFDTESLSKIEVPMQIVLGERDELLVPATNGEYYASVIPGCALTVISGAGHYVFLNEVKPEALAADAELAEIGVDPKGVNRANVHHQVARRAVDFFLREL